MTKIRTALRVAFTCVPQTGHLRPLLPLATELAGAGHEVVFVSGPAVADDVRGAGFGFAPVGPDLGEWFGRLAGRGRGQPGAGLAPERVERYFVPRLFGEIGLDLMYDGLDAFVRERRPDLIVYEPYVPAAPLIARLHDRPAVEHGIALPTPALVADLVEDAVTPAWSAAGLPAPGPAPADLAIDVCPPSLGGEAPAPGRRLRMRPAPLPAPGPLPVELPHPGRPLVYLTLGTFANSDLDLFRLLLRALATLPVDVLVTAGDDESAAALEADRPDNAVVAGFVPQAAVLPNCAAVVHHAGAGTTFGVLAHGRPSVALPRGADNFSMARHLGRAGAARVLLPDAIGEEAVRAAVEDVLRAPAYGRAAQGIAAEIAQLPAPGDVVPALEELTATRADRRKES